MCNRVNLSLRWLAPISKTRLLRTSTRMMSRQEKVAPSRATSGSRDFTRGSCKVPVFLQLPASHCTHSYTVLGNHANPVRQGKTLKRSNQRRQGTIPLAKPDLQRSSVLLLPTSHLRGKPASFRSASRDVAIFRTCCASLPGRSHAN